MAVLIMVFAALLGATFVTVVALNLNQTARDEDRIVAGQNAQAGLRFVNDQLTNSAAGDRWRPSDINDPPLPGDPAYNTYYTPFDRAQGWARTGAAGERIFSKFPDPRSDNVSDNSPTYLVEVKKLGNGEAPDNISGDKTNDLRITVIGQAPNNPAVFSTQVNYKAGMGRRPLTRVARSVTNWSFTDNRVPEAQVSGYTPGTPPVLSLSNLKGTFPAAPFYIMLGDAAPANPGATPLMGAVVTAVSGNQLTLAQALARTPNAGERIEIAAGIGAPRGVDFDNSGAFEANATRDERLDFRLSDTAGGNTTPGSVLINGSLLWFGNLLSTNLRLDSSTAPSSGIHTSGLMMNMPLTAGTTQVTASGTTGTGPFNNVPLVSDSLQANFPSASGDFATVPASEKDKVVSDGRNRIAGFSDPTNPTRETAPFIPPDITAGGNGFGRYRQLSKYSPPANSSDPATASLYGYGEGIYVNNASDKERKGTGTANQYTDMTQSDLRELWFNPGTSTSSNQALRLATPATPAATTKSLEEQHLRGWVGPDQFWARGALIELDPDNAKVYITLDSRTEGNTTAPTGERPNQGPVPSRGWRDVDGSLLGDSASFGGVYRQEFPWPVNGVIFAEGNIRIKGTASNAGIDPGRSLTVVSMSNIYIEGSLNAGARKVMLLAKKNVVLNPTGVVSRVEGLTRLRNTATAGASVLQVYDADAFQVNDWIEISTTTNKPQRRVVAVDTTNNTITIDTPLTSATVHPIGRIVRTINDPLFGTIPFNNYATRLSLFNDIIQRRFPANASQVRLAFRHNAERRDAYTVNEAIQTDTLSAPLAPVLTSATLTNKLAPAGTGIIQTTDKYLSVAYTELGLGATNDTDWFPKNSPPPASEVLALSYYVGEAADSNTGSDEDDLLEDMTKRRTTPAWHYSAAVQNNFNAASTPQNPPFFFLASVGNRPNVDPTTAPTTYPHRKSIFSALATADYTIPMGTSVVTAINGATGVLRSDQANATLGTASGFEEVYQFGFSPLHGAGAVAAAIPRTWEDILTIDQGFYQNNGTNDGVITYDDTYYTLDSRIIGNNIVNGLNNLAFRLNPLVPNFFDATTPPTPLPDIPFYRLSRLKLENLDQLNGAQFEKLAPGAAIDVQAYVYAQEGSWFVIPGTYFDEKVKTDGSGAFVDLNGIDGDGDGNLRDPGENADLNRDGTVSRGEQVAAYRYRRYNYQINFVGSIMENHTAIVEDPDGPAGATIGAVADWTDKWATVNIAAGNFSGATFTNNLTAAAGNFNSITYKYDDAAATGALENDAGFHPPTTPELMFQG